MAIKIGQTVAKRNGRKFVVVSTPTAGAANGGDVYEIRNASGKVAKALGRDIKVVF